MPTPLNVRRWKGIRLYYPKSEKAADELAQAENVMFDREGIIVSRPGFRFMGELTPAAVGAGTTANMGAPLCMWNSDFGNIVYMVFQKSSTAWISDGVNDWAPLSTVLTAAYEAVPYDSNLYFATSQWYDGTTMATHPGMPAGKESIAVHKDRLWTTSRNTTISGISPQRIYFSEPGVPATGAWPAANFIDVRTGTPNRGLVSYRDSIYIFKPEAIWVLNTGGLPANWTLRQLGDRGSVGGYTVYNNTLYWIGADGLFSYNGVEINKLSDVIQKHFDDILVEYDDTAQVVGYDGNLYIQYKQLGGPRIFWIYNIARKAFTKITPPFGDVTGRMLAIPGRAGVLNDSWTPGVYFGSGLNSAMTGIHKPNLWKLDPARHYDTDDNNIPYDYTIVVETAQMDFDEAHKKKRIQVCSIEGTFETLIIDQFDEEDRTKRAQWFSLDTALVHLKRFPGIGYCRSLRFKITAPAGPDGVKLYALRAELKPRGREADDQEGTYALQP